MRYLFHYCNNLFKQFKTGQHSRNITFSAAGALANPLLQLLAAPYLFRYLGSEVFGIWALVNALLSAASVANFGLGESATKFVAKSLAENKQALAVQIARGVLTLYSALGIVAAICLAAAAPWIAEHLFNLLGENILQGVLWIRIACIGLILRFIYGVFESVARGFHRYDTEAIYGTLSTMATTVAALLCVFTGFGLTAILVCSAGVLAVSTALLGLACARLANSWKLLLPTLSLSGIRPVIPFSFFAWLQSLNGFALHTCDRFLIGYFLGPSSVGFYSVCLQLVQTLHFILAKAFGFLFPAVVKAHAQGKQTELLALFRKTLFATTVFGICGSGFVFSFSHDILRLWMGADFAAHSGATLAILALWNLLLSTTVSQFYFLNAAGQERINTGFGFLSSAISLGAAVLLVPTLGERGAALAKIASSITGVFSRQVTLRRLFSRQVSLIAGYATMAVPMIAGALFLLNTWFCNALNLSISIIFAGYLFICALGILIAKKTYQYFLSTALKTT